MIFLELSELMELLIYFVMALVIVAIISMLRQGSRKELEELKEENKELKGQVKNLEKQLEEARARIRKYERNPALEVMYQELVKAVKASTVMIACPQHKDQVTIIADGTITCPKGHRLWPKEVKKENEQ